MNKTARQITFVIVVSLMLGAMLFAIIQLIKTLDNRPSVMSNAEIAAQVDLQLVRNRIEEVNSDTATAYALFVAQIQYLNSQIDRLMILEEYRRHKEKDPSPPDPQLQRYGL